MKVAIIGAGPSGLSCAIGLERFGINPDIFEISNRIGEKNTHMAAMLQIVNRPIKNPLNYLNQTYNLNLKPYGFVKKAIHNGPNSKATITGQLGYFFCRGQVPYSLEGQLFSMVKSSINFNTYVDYKKIKNEYDYVVIASGRHTEAKELGVWQDHVSTWAKGAIILGEFDIDTIDMWINKTYCNSGYAYLAPFSNKRASLTLVVSEAEEGEIDKYWDLFIETENLHYEFVEYYTREHFSGYVYPHKVDNTYFVGNAAGTIDPFLGFGQVMSILTGFEAAKSIGEGTDYENAIKIVNQRNLNLLDFRKIFDSLNNDGLDIFVKSIGFPGVDPFIYGTNLEIIKLGAMGIRVYDYLFGDKV